MLDKLDKNWLAAALLLASLGLFASPWLLGFAGATAPMVSVSVIGALLALLGLAIAGKVVDWAAGGAMAAGAWSLVAPVLFGFLDGPAFWAHAAAGLLAMLIGIAGIELAGRRPPQDMAGERQDR